MAGTGQPLGDSVDRVVRLHDRIIARWGGLEGIQSISGLRAALERPWTGTADGVEFYPGVLNKAAELLERLINYHPFVDGNKRTATILTLEYLREQGYVLDVTSDQLVDAAVRIADKQMRHDAIVAWLEHIAAARMTAIPQPPRSCPWCGSTSVEDRTIIGGQTGPIAEGGPRPATRAYRYWQCPDCGVTFCSGDKVLSIKGDRYRLHEPYLGGDPHPSTVADGPWARDDGSRPTAPGAVRIAVEDIDFPHSDLRESHAPAIVAAIQRHIAARQPPA